eukprot:15366898-Ditylum_brightwellii.AAC.2
MLSEEKSINSFVDVHVFYTHGITVDGLELEAEMTNFWRFRHEKFLRGLPDLLMEIKRSNGHAKEVEKEEEKLDVLMLKSEE